MLSKLLPLADTGKEGSAYLSWEAGDEGFSGIMMLFLSGISNPGFPQFDIEYLFPPCCQLLLLSHCAMGTHTFLFHSLVV